MRPDLWMALFIAGTLLVFLAVLYVTAEPEAARTFAAAGAEVGGRAAGALAEAFAAAARALAG